ncbi:ubiquitin-specific protease doa4 [Entomortierella beljakovae]|nr:ubiquitin-specific protease doa4 [Entomortierella beljakovae]
MTTILDTPQNKIQGLIALSKVQYDPKRKGMHYVRSAEAILAQASLNAKEARTKGDMEVAFVHYLKATTIVLEVVKSDKDFEKIKSDSEYLKIKKEVISIMKETEDIKELLTAKYKSIQEVEAGALATAAKGARSKPPPPPTKPDHLSSSRHNGVAPLVAPIHPTTSSIQSTSIPSTSIPSSASYMSNLSQPINSQFMTSAGMIQAPMASLSMSSNGIQPTSLASYQSLQPTAYSVTSPLLSAVPPKMAPLPYNMPSSAPTSTSFQRNPSPINFTTPVSGELLSSSIPSAGFKSPSPSPHLSNGIAQAAMINSNMPSPSNSIQSTTSVQSTTNPTPANTAGCDRDGKYMFPLSIKPQKLLAYMKQEKGPSILLIDIRMQVQYADARIKSLSVVNIEPPALRDGVSAKVLADQGMFNNPSSERRMFAERSTFQLVVFYDQESTALNTDSLRNLVRALHDLEFEKPLQRRPVLLEGGFNAWLECTGINWVEGNGVDNAKRMHPSPSMTTATINSSPLLSQDGTQPPALVNQKPQAQAILEKISRGGGVSRHDGAIISRTIDDIIKRDDGPQSMMIPRIGLAPSNGPYAAYPPTATPYSNINVSSYIPSSSYNITASNTSNGNNIPVNQGGYPGSHIMQPNHNAHYNQNGGYPTGGKTGQLEQRKATINNHWNNFGSERHSQVFTTPPIQGMNFAPGASMSATSADMNSSAGPSLPRPPLSSGGRPPIPMKPMRPLPQPPVMNDLKDYTKFGSGFSKIGGSQLGKTGLTNLGNTCFMNSVIQCLIATPPLSRFFLDGSFKRHINMKNPLGTQGKLASAFSDLIRSMWSGQSLVISPTSFRNAIGGFAPQFKGTEQHDSQEFLSFLLDGLHEDLKMLPRLPPPGDDEGSEADEARMEALPEYEASEIAWQRYLRRDHSIIVDLFQGQFKNRLCCTKCGKTSTTYNSFMYLALPIRAKVSGKNPQTLTSCLNAFVEPETMDGDNAWNCPNCKKARKATKQLTISRVPDVLLIQLKRFSSDGPFKNKIKAMVQYPSQDLDLTQYLPRRPGGAPPEPAIYDLYAVSNHSGEVSSGHYTACVRGEAPNSWINFDDSRVSPCDGSVAVSEHGYTLFYVRK